MSEYSYDLADAIGNWGLHNQPLFEESDFKAALAMTRRLRVEDTFSIDAKRHYLSGEYGEYHLMYVEMILALEAATERAYQALSAVYEKQMFKEGKLSEKVAHMLLTHCGWADSEVRKVVEAVEARNLVMHQGKRRFDGSDAYDHLDVVLRATEALANWIEQRGREHRGDLAGT